MIKFADYNDREQIKDLWHICFKDEYSYINCFLDNIFTENNCIVYLNDDGKIISQLFLIDGSLKTEKGVFKSYYLYAACSHPDFRNRGIMGQLIDYSKKYALENGYRYICLVPAAEHLFDYYSRFSFIPFFRKAVTQFTRNELSNICKNTDIIATESDFPIEEIRNKFLTNKPYFIHSKNTLDYAVLENRNNNGKLITAGNAYAFINTEEDCCDIYEICVDEKSLAGLIKAILNETDCENYVFQSPSDSFIVCSGSKIIINGMILAPDKNAEELIENIESAYLGLVFD